MYNTHSMRAGRAIDLYHIRHVPLDIICKLDQWKSSSIYTYLQMTFWGTFPYLWSIFLFPVEIKALKQLWFIEDEFVNETYHSLASMKCDYVVEKKPLPFVYQHYNVSCYTTNPLAQNKDVISRLLNCFIKALNDHAYLPQVIIMIPDHDLIHHIDDYGPGFRLLVGTSIGYIADQIDRAIEIRKDQLMAKCPGTIDENSVKIVWIKALGRMKSQDEATVKYKFNAELEEVLSQRGNHFIMDVQRAVSNVTDFNQFGDLSGPGRIRFWNEINRQLEMFIFKDISLCPLSRKEISMQKQMQQTESTTHARQNRNYSPLHEEHGNKHLGPPSSGREQARFQGNRRNNWRGKWGNNRFYNKGHHF